MTQDRKNLDDFWPFYISQHMQKSTRRLHFAGTTAGLLCLAAALLQHDPRWIGLGLIVSYGLAWIGHFFIEKNRPATFKYPLLSLRADFRMYALMWLGRMDAEMTRLQEKIASHLTNR